MVAVVAVLALAMAADALVLLSAETASADSFSLRTLDHENLVENP
jgi:hypothetical protein